MNFQKQANYRERKQKVEDENKEEQKAARKNRDRLRYLKRNKLVMQSKLNGIMEQQRKLNINSKVVVVKLKTNAAKHEQVEDQIKEVQEALNTLGKPLKKKEMESNL